MAHVIVHHGSVTVREALNLESAGFGSMDLASLSGCLCTSQLFGSLTIKLRITIPTTWRCYKFSCYDGWECIL